MEFPFSTILDEHYQKESRDEEDKEITQLVEIHLLTPEDQTEKTLVKSELGIKSEEKEEIENLLGVQTVGCGAWVSRHAPACLEGRPSGYAE